MPTLLYVTNIGVPAVSLFALALGLLTLIKERRSAASVVFFLLTAAFAGVSLAHVLGVNRLYESEALIFLRLTAGVVLIAALAANFVIVLIGRLRQNARSLFLIYVTAAAILSYFAFHPARFLKGAYPKLYFPIYYSAGEYHYLPYLFAAAVLLYLCVVCASAWGAGDSQIRNRIKYLLIGMFLLFGFGSSLYFSVHVKTIFIDPAYFLLAGLFAVPLRYAMRSYTLIEIRKIAAYSVIYAAAVGLVGLIIGFLSYLNARLVIGTPGFPIWLIPTLSSAAVVAAAGYIWQKLHETETAKREFITVITHKFRTPLTYIKWSIGDLSDPSKSHLDRQAALEDIKAAHLKIEELTEVLLGLTRREEGNFNYRFEPRALGPIVAEVVKSVSGAMDEKNIQFSLSLLENLPKVSLDERRIQFAFQILLENAVNYNQRGGIISVRAATVGSSILTAIRDSGIGIKKEDMPFLFTKFFRSGKAKAADTEGMGIGLYMVKNIIERHGGEIWAESPGEGKGATFYVKLPQAKQT